MAQLSPPSHRWHLLQAGQGAQRLELTVTAFNAAPRS